MRLSCCARSVACAAVLAAAVGGLLPAFAEEERPQPPVRVVPKLVWPGEGVVSPDGRFAAAIERFGALYVVDLRDRCLAWHVPMSMTNLTAVAFSPDGARLAACSIEEGVLVELSSGTVRQGPELAGTAVAFSPDSKRLFLVSLAADEPRPNHPTLKTVDLKGRKTYSQKLDMSAPESILPAPDGKVTVYGLDGRLDFRVPSACEVEQTLDPETGEGITKRGRISREFRYRRMDSPAQKMPTCDDKDNFGQRAHNMWRGPAAGLWMTSGFVGAGGRGAHVWDFRRGRLLRHVPECDPAGFGPSGAILADAWHEQKQALSLFDIATGKETRTNVEGLEYLPSPDGTHVGVVRRMANGRDLSLELWHVQGTRPVSSSEQGVSEHVSWGWSRKGDCLMRIAFDAKELSALELHYIDGRPPKRISVPDSVADVPQPALSEEEARIAEALGIGREKMLEMRRNDLEVKSRDRRRIWCFDDDGSGLIALGVGQMDEGRVVVVNREKAEPVAELRGFPIWLSAVQFLGPGRILAGDEHGNVRLWDCTKNHVLWSAHGIGVIGNIGAEPASRNPEAAVVQFDAVEGGEILVSQDQFGSARIVRMADGVIMRRMAGLAYWEDSSRRSSSCMPCLACDGSLCLEWEGWTAQVNLVQTETGKKLLTYCPLPGDEWIVYTPDGWWDGSKEAGKWVSFYRGDTRSAAGEADGLRSREKIDAILAAAFGGRPGELAK